MAEWDAPEYARVSGLQEAMAEEVLSTLSLSGSERVLDLGCGNGKITAEIAVRLPQGSILGVDVSEKMISFASSQYGTTHANLHFEVADVRHATFKEQFDLVVSFNALHWIPQQEDALRSLRSAMKSDGRAKLRLVPKGPRKSLEDVLEETRQSAGWARYFEGFHDPYLHLTPDQYGALAQRNGLHVLSIQTEDKAWDFGSRATFAAFGDVTFIEWTQYIPEADRHRFVMDVLDRYQRVATDRPGEENTFKFYQMNVALSRR